MSGDPDYTAGVLIGRSNLGDYYVLDVERFRKSTSQVIERIIEVGLKDGPDICTTVITKDPGGAAAHFHSFLAKALIEAGLSVKSLISSGWTRKLGRFKPFSAMSEQGNIYVLRADWNEAWFTELEAFTGGDRKIHDDMVDATGDAFNTLTKKQTLPTFTCNWSDFTKSSPFNQ